MNVQCVVDHDKKVLWASTYHKGGSHDSSTFRETKLYKKLKKKADWLHEEEFFILADSAYAIESFIIPPYLRNDLRQAIEDHNMHRPCKDNQWDYDSNNHIIRY